MLFLRWGVENQMTYADIAGVATGLIHLASNLEMWENKFKSVIVSSNPLPDMEWVRFYELLDDWVANVEDTAKLTGSSQTQEPSGSEAPVPR